MLKSTFGVDVGGVDGVGRVGGRRWGLVGRRVVGLAASTLRDQVLSTGRKYMCQTSWFAKYLLNRTSA